MNTLEEMKQKMMTFLETDKDFAAHIGRASRAITDSMLAEDTDNELDPKQRINYAVFFCVGASWVINDEKTKLIISQRNEYYHHQINAPDELQRCA